MAESPDDKAVDRCIQEMQDVLDRLKSEQAKDVEDESGEEDTPRKDQPKSLRGAARKARAKFRQGRGEKADDDSDY